jgi:hypothetical protein
MGGCCSCTNKTNTQEDSIRSIKNSNIITNKGGVAVGSGATNSSISTEKTDKLVWIIITLITAHSLESK